MKQLSLDNLSYILGGWADPEKCKEVQDRAPELKDQEDPDWDKWCEDFYKYCLGVEL